MEDLSVSTEIVKGYLVVKLVGELGMFNSTVFTDCVEEDIASEGRDKIIIDASGLKFVDSCGVGALVSVYKRVKPSGGFVHIAGAQAGLMETLTITQLTKVFPLFKTVEDAIVGASGSSQEVVDQVGGGTIASTVSHKFLVLKMTGAITEKEIPQAKEALSRFSKEATSAGMIYNVAGLTALDSAGMAFIQESGAEARWIGGRSIFAGANSKIKSLLHQAAIDHQFEFFDDMSNVISESK